ncbi:MAG: hypothetical protein ACM3SV_15070 [Betaproteobacteria bacterium]
MIEQPVEPEIAADTQRLAAVSALRRIRRIVDCDQAEEEFKSRWASRIGAVAGVLLIVAITWTLYRFMR